MFRSRISSSLFGVTVALRSSGDLGGVEDAPGEGEGNICRTWASTQTLELEKRSRRFYLPGRAPLQCRQRVVGRYCWVWRRRHVFCGAATGDRQGAGTRARVAAQGSGAKKRPAGGGTSAPRRPAEPRPTQLHGGTAPHAAACCGAATSACCARRPAEPRPREFGRWRQGLSRKLWRIAGHRVGPRRGRRSKVLHK